MAHFENWAKTIGVFQKFSQFLPWKTNDTPLLQNTLNLVEKEKDEGFDSRDVSFSHLHDKASEFSQDTSLFKKIHLHMLRAY